MILVDANLLIYATNLSTAQHSSARAWLEAAINSEARVGLPWSSLHAFLRLSTNARIHQPPLAPRTAWKQVEEWLDQENVWVPAPGVRHRNILGRLLTQSKASGNLIPDAVLAALAIEHGLELCSTDRDFARFEGLRWRDPLKSD